MATDTSILRRVNVALGGAPNPNLTGKSFPLGGLGAFSMQVFFTALGPASAAQLGIMVSNDDVNFVPANSVPGQTIFPYGVSFVGNAHASYFIFCGGAEGVATALYARLALAPGSVGPGTIDKVIFNGQPA